MSLSKEQDARGARAFMRVCCLVVALASGCAQSSMGEPPSVTRGGERDHTPSGPSEDPDVTVEGMPGLQLRPSERLRSGRERELPEQDLGAIDIGNREPIANPEREPSEESEPVTPKPDVRPREQLPPLPAPIEGVCAFDAPNHADVTVENANCPDGVWHGPLILESDANVESARGCTRVTGYLTLHTAYVTSLEPLSSLRVVEGALNMDDMVCSDRSCGPGTSKLSNLAGLDSLRCVGGDVEVGHIYSRPLDYSALGNLVEIGGDLDVWRDAESFNRVFASLRRVWGDIFSVGPLQPARLEAVYGDYRVQGGSVTEPNFYVGCAGDNYCRDGVLGCDLSVGSAEEARKLASCQIAVQDLRLSGSALDELSSLSNLRYVRGGLSLTSGPNPQPVENIRGLESLRRVGWLMVGYLPNLKSLEGISHLEIGEFGLARLDDAIEHTLGLIDLYELPELQDLRGLSRIESASALRIRHCDGLRDLTGLESLRTLRELMIENNANLQSLAGIEQLHTLRAAIQLRYNPVLADLSALGGLESAYLDLEALPALADLRGLGGVPIRVISIRDLPTLRNLDGLEGLLPGSTISVSENAALEDVEALAHLRDVRSIRISQNPALPSLGGLQQLETISHGGNISRNASLPHCEVVPMLLRFPMLEGTLNDYDATCEP